MLFRLNWFYSTNNVPVNYKKGCTRLAAASDKGHTSCLPMVGGSLRLLRLLPPLKLVAMIYIAEILLKVALNTKNQKSSNHSKWLHVGLTQSFCHLILLCSVIRHCLSVSRFTSFVYLFGIFKRTFLWNNILSVCPLYLYMSVIIYRKLRQFFC